MIFSSYFGCNLLCGIGFLVIIMMSFRCLKFRSMEQVNSRSKCCVACTFCYALNRIYKVKLLLYSQLIVVFCGWSMRKFVMCHISLGKAWTTREWEFINLSIFYMYWANCFELFKESIWFVVSNATRANVMGKHRKHYYLVRFVV